MRLFPFYLVILLVFMNRYVFGLFLKTAKGRSFDATRADYEPTVTIVTPMFNEGRGIARTIRSVAGLEYPKHRLDMVVVDDASTDDSHQAALQAARDLPNVHVLRNRANVGKRKSIIAAVRESTSEIIVSIDSDVQVAPDALRKLVARFTRPDIAAVGGRVNLSNANQNWLTRMQAVKYYFGYEFLKNLERSLQTVMCLSGCLTAYRRSALIELEPILAGRCLLGVPIKYGEDRFLTRQLVKRGYRTVSTLDAVCFTLAPSTLRNYFAQQLRWRRSNLVDVLGGVTHVWSLHPLVCTHYLGLASMLVAYPLVVLQELAAGSFFDLACFNLAVLSCMAALYWVRTRSLPAGQRVHPVWFLAAAVVMPVTYVLFTPLAFFTLDSSSWETRGKPVRAATRVDVEIVAPLSRTGLGATR